MRAFLILVFGFIGLFQFSLVEGSTGGICSVSRPQIISNAIISAINSELAIVDRRSELISRELEHRIANELSATEPVELSVTSQVSRTQADSGVPDLSDTEDDRITMTASVELNPTLQEVRKDIADVNKEIAGIEKKLAIYSHEIDIILRVLEYAKAEAYLGIYKLKDSLFNENLKYLNELGALGDPSFFEKRSLQQDIVDNQNLINASEERKRMISRQFGVSDVPNIDFEIDSFQISQFEIPDDCKKDINSLPWVLLSKKIELQKLIESERHLLRGFNPELSVSHTRDLARYDQSSTQIRLSYALSVFDQRRQEGQKLKNEANISVLYMQLDSLNASLDTLKLNTEKSIAMYDDVIKSAVNRLTDLADREQSLKERQKSGDSVFRELINVRIEYLSYSLLLIDHQFNLVDRWLAYWGEFLPTDGIFLNESI